jgi:hypothetical protein
MVLLILETCYLGSENSPFLCFMHWFQNAVKKLLLLIYNVILICLCAFLSKLHIYALIFLSSFRVSLTFGQIL